MVLVEDDRQSKKKKKKKFKIIFYFFFSPPEMLAFGSLSLHNVMVVSAALLPPARGTGDEVLLDACLYTLLNPIMVHYWTIIVFIHYWTLYIIPTCFSTYSQLKGRLKYRTVSELRTSTSSIPLTPPSPIMLTWYMSACLHPSTATSAIVSGLVSPCRPPCWWASVWPFVSVCGL